MPYRKQQFASGEIYHLVSRGLDDRLIFKDIDENFKKVEVV